MSVEFALGAALAGSLILNLVLFISLRTQYHQLLDIKDTLTTFKDTSNIGRYQTDAARTLGDSDHRILGLGVAGEAGEVAEIIKKAYGHGIRLDDDKLKKELGDVLWYVACMCTRCGYSLREVMARNIQKLKRRYPEGFVEGGGNR